MCLPSGCVQRTRQYVNVSVGERVDQRKSCQVVFLLGMDWEGRGRRKSGQDEHKGNGCSPTYDGTPSSHHAPSQHATPHPHPHPHPSHPPTLTRYWQPVPPELCPQRSRRRHPVTPGVTALCRRGRRGGVRWAGSDKVVTSHASHTLPLQDVSLGGALKCVLQWLLSTPTTGDVGWTYTGDK